MKFKFSKMCDFIMEEDLTSTDIYGPSFLQKLKLFAAQDKDNDNDKPEIGDLVYLEINGNLDPQISKDRISFAGTFKIEKIFKSEMKLIPYYEVFKDERFDIEDGSLLKYPDEPIVKPSANKEIDIKKYKDIGKIVPDNNMNKSITINLEQSKILRMPNDSSLQPKWHIVTSTWEPWDPKQNQMKT